MDRDFADSETLPIGRACDNCDLILLREDGTEAAPGEIGELCVRGSFVASGYYGDPEKTDAAFIQNPLNPWYPEKIYKTGDLVRYNERGELLYLGRRDFQIKHMGSRIELGEVEAAAGAAADVKSCVSIYDEDRDRIILFYEGGPKNENQMQKTDGKQTAGVYAAWGMHSCEANAGKCNGKIDRKYLKSYYADLMEGQAIG